MRVRLHHQVKDRRARIADMKGVSEALKDQTAPIVDGVEGNVLREGLSGLVELEAGEDVERQALAWEGQELAVSSPVEEI